MLLGHPAASVRSAAAASVLADLRHWAAQASAEAVNSEPQEAAVHSSAGSAAGVDASEDPSPGASSGKDPHDELMQKQLDSAAKASRRVDAGSGKQEPDAPGQPAQQLSPAQVKPPLLLCSACSSRSGPACCSAACAVCGMCSVWMSTRELQIQPRRQLTMGSTHCRWRRRQQPGRSQASRLPAPARAAAAAPGPTPPPPHPAPRPAARPPRQLVCRAQHSRVSHCTCAAGSDGRWASYLIPGVGCHPVDQHIQNRHKLQLTEARTDIFTSLENQQVSSCPVGPQPGGLAAAAGAHRGSVPRSLPQPPPPLRLSGSRSSSTPPRLRH